ncbi:MAG: winged helix-turn-helix transcriptional regulator [Nitrospiraceae bacterium]|nr:MAG: winged helix-turn-helix transcriptional regulator [Nitrospiraceae bacterium]
MKNLTDILKLLSDEHRLRTLMLLNTMELSVCQIMGIIGSSQSLTSRNLSLLYRGGFLDERRDGKLRYYSIRRDLSEDKKAVLALLRTMVKSDKKYKEDLLTLKECTEFQKKTGKCDMKTLQEFMRIKKKDKQIRDQKNQSIIQAQYDLC